MNTRINKDVIFENLGLVGYKEAWEYQEKLFAGTIALKINNRNLESEKQQFTPNYLIFCQHPHVYTLGKNGKETHLLINEDELTRKEAAFFRINRGGDVTYHGPGQLVGYPILDLDNFFTDIHRYMRTLEEAVIRTLSEFGLNAGRIDGLTGVWLGHDGGSSPRKICAMGVKSSRWVTMHGFALNINPDLSYFNHIVPCGISDKAVTSMQEETGREIPVGAVSEALKAHIAALFGMKLI